MTEVIMHGCNGHMGRCITNLIAGMDDVRIVAGIDLNDSVANDYPVFKNINDCDVKADAIIDFASPLAVDALIDYAVAKQIPVCVCSTGLSEAQIAKLKEASTKVAVLRSANMSLGINLLIKMLKDATQVLSPAGYDIEIVEKHHNLKKDAPSGTALALAESVNEAADNKYEFVFDRSGRSEARHADEIGISAVRGGTIVGEHDVIFCGEDEVITFSHTAYSKALFGKGAIEAAKFLKGKGPGMYNMQDVIG